MNILFFVSTLLLPMVSLFCEEKKMIIVSCFYNVSSTISKTLDSLFSQNYQNMHILLVDDASTDGTPELVRQYIQTTKKKKPCTFIENKKRKRKLANVYSIFHACDPDSVILLVDGDDWLKHTEVLSYLNEVYQDTSVWMTYGDYENIPKNIATLWGIQEKSYCAPVANHNIRKKPFVFMHPRSFYAWLFHLIPLSDMICETIPGFQGNFFPAGNDMAIFFPMAELAGTHVRYIKDILYYRNVTSPLVGFKIDHNLQKKAGEEIRKKIPQQPLAKKKYYKNIAEQDVAVFGIDTNKSLKQCRYVVYHITKPKQLYSKNTWCSIAQIIEKTGAAFCLLQQKPTRSIPFFENNYGTFYAWKRSLNKKIPLCETIIIKKQLLSQFAKIKTTLLEKEITNFLQSKEYDIGLSFIFH